MLKVAAIYYHVISIGLNLGIIFIMMMQQSFAIYEKSVVLCMIMSIKDGLLS